MSAESAFVAAVIDRLRIGGRDVMIRYANADLARSLGRATRHLSVPGDRSPDLKIDVWTDRDLPLSLPSDWPCYGMSYSTVGSVAFSWLAPDGPLYSYDRERRCGSAVFTSNTAIPTWDQAAPFRRILHWWAEGQGLQLIHAAAVASASGGVLLVGRGGSGKSTTALACLEAGMGFAGDDYCVLSPGDPPRVDSVYLSAKADHRSAELIPGLRAYFAQAPFTSLGKSVLFADEIRPASLCAGFPLRGIIVPQLNDDATCRLTRISPAQALRALAPSTLMQMPRGRAREMAGMAEMVQRVPAWALTLGSPVEAAKQIKLLLDEIAKP